MSSAGVYQPGTSLAEADVMWRLYKEKMKETMAAVSGDREKEERTMSGGGRGCFSLPRVFGNAHVHYSSVEAPRVAPPE
ncbi:hypothetical protein BT93_L5516 [Corymbia citriodora subsp. variegata]|uniref:Uncharacterized protein n=1 Tax=Corymbia citriodora subsp. variegata TaxID=360336 RepID=A0A8T0CS36_CORYI|nr:hypothetical protein BT93_L5516 [Corymbia citriodora subsp. variegata]